MYSQFFGLEKLPFRLRPDPEFLYSGPEYVRARSSLIAALRGGFRVTVFSGPPGVGKTLLLDDVVHEIGEQFALCRINQPHISAPELLQALMLQLEIPGTDTETERSQLNNEASTTLERTGKYRAPALLIIDDAQLLPTKTLLALPKILAKTPRLKIVLVARQDPRHSDDDLLSRLDVAEKPHSVRLGALTAGGVRAYIEHRLSLAGGGGKDLFTPDAFPVIYQHTAGSPRLINVLCDAALHAACLRASGHVSGSEIGLATQDSRWPEALARDKAAIVIDEHINADSVTAVAPLADEPLADAPPAEARPGELPAAPVPHSAAATSARFIVSYRETATRDWPLHAGRISIGRAADNELRLDAPDVSRHHCEVVISADVSVIEDLGSVNGIKVNGKPVTRHILQHEDVVTLGEHVLKYVVGGDA
jgi:type II secretory pathway predicted ATPase ExeA